VQYCAAQGGDVESPVWIDKTGAIEYVLDAESDQTVYTEKGCNEPSRLFRPRSGVVRIQDEGYDYASPPLIEAAVNGPPRLLSPGSSSFPGAEPAVEPRQMQSPAIKLWLSGSSHPIPAWLWPATEAKSIRKGLVIVHGGPHLHESGDWEPLRDAFQRSGYSVLAPNYAGSSGYGKEFESTANLDVQTRDVLAAVKYLSTSQMIQPDNIIVFASSFGTQPVLQALRLDPHMCRIVIFAPFLGSSTKSDSYDPLPFDGIVLAFHGQDDPITDSQHALFLLQKIFKTATREHRLYWRQFDHEGHGFSRISSLQEEYGTITCMFEPSSCPDGDPREDSKPIHQ
jgi:dienelactone hydrolase